VTDGIDIAESGRPHRADTDAPGAPDVSTRLHRLERQFAQIQRLAQFGSWEWDIAKDVVTWSDELYRISGVDPGKLVPTYESILGHIHPDDRDALDDAVQRAIADRASYALDHRLVRPDGDVRWLHSRGNVSVDADGEPQRLYGVTIDITERRRSEQFLRDFIGNASHALGTPAAVILQAADVLADGNLGPEERDAAMDALLRQSRRLHDLSTNLFDLVALDKGAPSVMLGLSIMLAPVALAERVRKASAALPPAAGTTLTIDVAPDIVVLAEPIELERVFLNLLDNARTHGGPNVSVTASRLADEVIVDVRDDGPGVSDEDLHDLFAPFAKRQSAGQGPGLGLAIVHQLMVAFGGAISYRRAEPHGSVFTLRFSVE
jgi:PAS domain S-box-containing protein